MHGRKPRPIDRWSVLTGSFLRPSTRGPKRPAPRFRIRRSPMSGNARSRRVIGSRYYRRRRTTLGDRPRRVVRHRLRSVRVGMCSAGSRRPSGRQRSGATANSLGIVDPKQRPRCIGSIRFDHPRRRIASNAPTAPGRTPRLPPPHVSDRGDGDTHAGSAIGAGTVLSLALPKCFRQARRHVQSPSGSNDGIASP